MATFSGGKALLRTDRIFVRTQSEYGQYSASNAGSALYTFGDNEYGILRPIYMAVAAGALDGNNHIHVAAYCRQDYIENTNNGTIPTPGRRQFDLGLSIDGNDNSGLGKNFSKYHGANNNTGQETAAAPFKELPTEIHIPANFDLRILTNFSGTVPSDEFFVFIAEIDVYRINNVIGNP